MNKLIITLLLGLLFALPASGDEAAVRKYRNYTPKQLQGLSEKELHSEVPMMYSMAARRGLSVGSELLFGMELNQLMYPGIHDYGAAVRAFQVDLGDKPTGELTVWQIDQLGRRAEMQKLATVGFPDAFVSYIDDSYAAVEGTVVIIDDKIAWPINHVRVSCSRRAGTCDVEQIHIATPNDQSWSQTYQVLERPEESYEIARWGEDSIESHPLGTSESCRSTSLNFNFKTKEFYYITRNAGGDCKLMLGGELEQLSKPRVSQIVDGEKIIQEEFAKIQVAAYEVLSSSFRRQVDELKEKGARK